LGGHVLTTDIPWHQDTSVGQDAPLSATIHLKGCVIFICDWFNESILITFTLNI